MYTQNGGDPIKAVGCYINAAVVLRRKDKEKEDALLKTSIVGTAPMMQVEGESEVKSSQRPHNALRISSEHPHTHPITLS
jgi:hypothetical protein